MIVDWGKYSPGGVALCVGFLLLAGVRVLDRRPKLLADSRGIQYYRWGPWRFAWSEFTYCFRAVNENRAAVEMVPGDPHAFLAKLPPWRRLALRISWLRSTPRFFIDLEQLDVEGEQAFQALRTWHRAAVVGNVGGASARSESHGMGNARTR